MFVLIIVIDYYIVCLITVSIDHKRRIDTDVRILCRLNKFHHITDLIHGSSLAFCQSTDVFLILQGKLYWKISKNSTHRKKKYIHIHTKKYHIPTTKI